MKKKFNCLVQYLRNNYFSYWAVLALDTFIALCSTLAAYTGIHYITETFFKFPCFSGYPLVSLRHPCWVHTCSTPIATPSVSRSCANSEARLAARLSKPPSWPSPCDLFPASRLATQPESILPAVRLHAHLHRHGRCPQPHPRLRVHVEPHHQRNMRILNLRHRR